MTDAPETRYTRSADGTNLGYQVSSKGPLEVVFNNASGVPIDLLLEDPGFVPFRRRLGTFSRTVVLALGTHRAALADGHGEALTGFVGAKVRRANWHTLPLSSPPRVGTHAVVTW